MKLQIDDFRDTKATVYKVLREWKLGGLRAVETYLNSKYTVILENTWSEKIKKKIKKKNYENVSMEIENLYLKFKLLEDEVQSDKTKGTKDDSPTGIGA